MSQELRIEGAREHNLQDLDLSLPREALVVVTGPSGSGKSSLAFATLYAEGQRRYLESFSAYARQFMGKLERPAVDRIDGLSPVIAIEQKTTSRNPRSTVGTTTEIYDFLRLLYARVGQAHSWVSGKPMQQFSQAQIMDSLTEDYKGRDLMLLAPLVRSRKGHYRELFEQWRKQGFTKVRIDGEVTDLRPRMQVDRYKVHDIELIVDVLVPGRDSNQRLKTSVELATRLGKGVLLCGTPGEEDPGVWAWRYFSKLLTDPENGLAYDEPQPNTFSFNLPYGACPRCQGLGSKMEADPELVFGEDETTLGNGGLAPLGEYKDNWIFRVVLALGKKNKFSLQTKVAQLTNEQKQLLLYGQKEPVAVDMGKERGLEYHSFDGLMALITRQDEWGTAAMQEWVQRFVRQKPCAECGGGRLKKEALHFWIEGKSIADLCSMELQTLQDWLGGLEGSFQGNKARVADEILKELRLRLQFLLDVGLGYLHLHRSTATLSGGESQRIRLASQLGSGLSGVLYILDEPSIGLHPRDNRRLIGALRNLRDLGNTVLVVEHDEEMIRAADWVVDLGPGAGSEGGRLVSQGSPEDLPGGGGLTADYLSGKKKVGESRQRTGNGPWLGLKGATGHNLHRVDLRIPLGCLIGVSGVSGSGKSSLVNETLVPALSNQITGTRRFHLPFKALEGWEHLDKIIEIDQSPIGRTPRSNPATYTGLFTEIRQIFAEMPLSKIRGYTPGRFSFNVAGGRCEACGGAGVRVLEMNFLPDVELPCENCGGKRYQRDTLEVRYKGRNIHEVLSMSINEAVPFFDGLPHLRKRLSTLEKVGLGYLQLGQPATTLSGGEAQRLKLAAELGKREGGQTLYILDEPTTGLHMEDIRVLVELLQALVDKGHTVLVIEHQIDLLRATDYLVDLGPEGGAGGGNILWQGFSRDWKALAGPQGGSMPGYTLPCLLGLA
ncbi:MAG: excinuclease ABC subunit UvrA [Bacteroidota bacterium]